MSLRDGEPTDVLDLRTFADIRMANVRRVADVRSAR